MARLLVLALLLFPAVALAQAGYRWVDEQGGIHYSGNLDSIPEKFRSSATPLSAPAPKPSGPPGATAPSPAAPGSRLTNPYNLPPGGPLPSQTRTPPGPAPGWWEIAHPQGFLLKFADHAKCQEQAEKISQTFKRTVSCYARSD